jgi:hypothetical protein
MPEEGEEDDDDDDDDLRRVLCLGYVKCMEETRNACQILGGKSRVIIRAMLCVCV